MTYYPKIGLEVHTQLKTRSKLFCPCSTEVQSTPNENICEICLGYPGSMPMINHEAITQAIKICSVLNTDPLRYIVFDRKHYNYPDMTKNYQITQFYHPIGSNGFLEFPIRSRFKKISIQQIHIEEDAAKLTHYQFDTGIDFNRSGQPLVEMVTNPDFNTGEEAEKFLRYYQFLLRYIEASDANMELGQLRCDVNISVSKVVNKLGTKVELKNLNSPNFIKKAIEYEINRQSEIISSNRKVEQETRRWNESRAVTEPMRKKEQALDYRYIPEPDIQKIIISKDEVEKITNAIPENPVIKLKRYTAEYGLKSELAECLVTDSGYGDLFDEIIVNFKDPGFAARYIFQIIQPFLKKNEESRPDEKLTPKILSELIQLVSDESISTQDSKKVLKLLLHSKKTVNSIVQDENLLQEKDLTQINKIVSKGLAENSDIVKEIETGNTSAIHRLLDKIKKDHGRSLNYKLALDSLLHKLPIKSIDVIAAGGAITSKRDIEGVLKKGSESSFDALIANAKKSFNIIKVNKYIVSFELSENLLIEEWLQLYAKVQNCISDGYVSGVAITHGLDTIAYSAPLLRWVLQPNHIPIIFVGSTKSMEDEDSDAVRNVSRVFSTILEDIEKGIWVYTERGVLPAYNIKMENLSGQVYTINNLDKASYNDVAKSVGIEKSIELIDLKEAYGQTFFLRVYPGMSHKVLRRITESGIKYLILELFDTGTANTRWGSDETIIPIIKEIDTIGGAVFCTSQLGVTSDLFNFESSRALWNAGIIPLNNLVSETAFTKLIAAQLFSSSTEEVKTRMTAVDELV